MRYYCSLWDINYMYKGLALYASLARHAQPFQLFVLAMDDETYQILGKLALPGMEVIPMKEFEDSMGLWQVRQNRTWQEYCWTCASQLLEFLYHMAAYPMWTYLDADLYFFSSPQVIYDEIGDRSIAIVPHRFSRRCQHLIINGIYNVSWVSIRNTIAGRTCLGKWARQCRDWCYYRNEDGKFGDQAYLDTWPTDFPGEVAVLNHIGVGTAPWNLSDYVISRNDRGGFSVRSKDGPTPSTYPFTYDLIFHHFHEFQDARHLTHHPLTPEQRTTIYAHYTEAIRDARRLVEAVRIQTV